MLKMIFASIILTVLVFAEVPVLKTGQTIVYTEYDDGYYQAGKVRSYSRSGDVVIDDATGLEWQDNEAVEKTWDDAISYCSNLPLDDGGWRLPSIEELETLGDDGQHNPSVTEGIFNHISSSGTSWSSTTDIDRSTYTWVVYLYSGFTAFDNKAASNDVRCVRGEPMEFPHTFSRNDATEIVSDETTGLQWQDDEMVQDITRNWTSAIDYCENTLTLGEYNDWRLPNHKELLSIVDRSQREEPAIDDTFVNTASPDARYWSSTTFSPDTGNGWVVYLTDGEAKSFYKTDSYYVRCVRGGQFDTFDLSSPSVIMYLLN